MEFFNILSFISVYSYDDSESSYEQVENQLLQPFVIPAYPAFTF